MSFVRSATAIFLIGFLSLTLGGCDRGNQSFPPNTQTVGASPKTDDDPAESSSQPDTSGWGPQLEATGYDRVFSIIVGIDEYSAEESDLDPLQFAVNDARELRDVLQQEFGFASENCKFLTNKTATKAALIEALQIWLPGQKLTANDALLVFFAGHGLIDLRTNAGDGYLATVDSRRADFERSCLPVSWLAERLKELPCGHKLLILDSCYSGSLFQQRVATAPNTAASEQSIAVQSRSAPAKQSFSHDGPKKASATNDQFNYYFAQPCFVGMSAGRITPVADGLGANRHSVFTEALIQELRNRADSGRSDQSFTFRDLAARTETRVREKPGSQQIPDWGQLVPGDGDFIFKPTLHRLTPTQAARRKAYAHDIKLAADALEHGDCGLVRELLARYPRPSEADDYRGFEWYYLWRECHREAQVITGHKAPVGCIAFTPDSRTLVSAGCGEIHLWDVRTATELPRLNYKIPFRTPPEPVSIPSSDDLQSSDPTINTVIKKLQKMADGLASFPDNIPHTILAIAISQNGNQLATACDDQTIHVWDLPSRESAATFKGHTEPVWSLSFAPDGATLVSGSEDTFVKIWDVPQKKELRTLPAPWAVLWGDGHFDKVNAVAFSPNGNLLTSCGNDGTLRFWDPKSGKETARLELGRFVIWIAFSPDGERIAVLTATKGVGTLKVLDVKTKKLLSSIEDNVELSFSGAFSPDGTMIAAAATGNAAALWDIKTGKIKRLFRGHTDKISSVSISPSGEILATCSSDRTVRLWKLDDEEDFPRSTQIGGVRRVDAASSTSNRVRSVAVSPNGQSVATTSDAGFQLWDVATQKPIVKPDDSNFIFAPRALAFSPGGEVVVGVDEFETRIFDVDSGRMVAALPFDSNSVLARNVMAFTKDGRQLAVIGDVKTRGVTLWDTQSWKKQLSLAQSESNLVFVSFTPDGQSVVTASTDGFVKLWDKRSGAFTSEIHWEPSRNGIMTAALAPDGSRLALADSSSMITIWNISSQEQEHTFGGHSKGLEFLEFSPDSKTLLSCACEYGSRSGEMILWQVETGDEILRLRDHESAITCLGFSSQTQLLATGSDVGTVKFWRGTSDSEPLAR